MQDFVRTEVLNQMYLNVIKPYGGHPDLFLMSVDWMRAPWLTNVRQSYICLTDETKYVITLFNQTCLDIAVLGYDVHDDVCVVRQIQGQFNGQHVLPKRWERVLLATTVALAKFSRMRRVEVIPSWENEWYKCRADAQLRQQLQRRYDTTPHIVGFTCACSNSLQHHVLDL